MVTEIEKTKRLIPHHRVRVRPFPVLPDKPASPPPSRMAATIGLPHMRAGRAAKTPISPVWFVLPAAAILMVIGAAALMALSG